MTESNCRTVRLRLSCAANALLPTAGVIAEPGERPLCAGPSLPGSTERKQMADAQPSPLDADRLWTDVMALADITDPAAPLYAAFIHRRCFSKAAPGSRRRFEEAGLHRADRCRGQSDRPAGRQQSRRSASSPSARTATPCPSGGRFDGIAGVLSGLEVVRALRDSGIPLEHTHRSHRFPGGGAERIWRILRRQPRHDRRTDGQQCWSLTGPGGETLRDALCAASAAIPTASMRRVRDDISAFLELHIEQGIVLESQALDVGIVTSIVGIRRIEIVFAGRPIMPARRRMAMRRDALVAGRKHRPSRCGGIAGRADARRNGLFRRHRRHPHVEPGAANVVRRKCRLVDRCRTTSPDVDATLL